jgi:hypothetical protein
MEKKIWNTDSFFNNFLFPMIVLVLYGVSYTLIVPKIYSTGVNIAFTDRLWKIVIVGILVVHLFYFLILKLKDTKIIKFVFKHSQSVFEYSMGNINKGDFLLLLLPLTPVVQYIINNQEMLSFTEMLIVLAFFLLFSSLYIFIIPVIFGNGRSIRTLMILGTTFAFTVISMPFLSQQFSWYELGRLKFQLPIFIGVFLAIWILYNLKQRRILYLLLGLIFVTNSITQLISINKPAGDQSASTQSKLPAMVKGRTPVAEPNIYLLVYDSYVPNEVMKAYGFDNSAQADYLSSQGFKVYPRIYSIGSATAETMSRVFDVSSVLIGNPRKGISGDGVVQEILKNLGYKTYGIFPTYWEFYGIGSSYDYSYPELATPAYVQMIGGVLIGEFRFDLSFEEHSHDQYVNEKQSILRSISHEQAFVYTHTNVPAHSQNSGACRPNEIELYKERVTGANIEMQQDIETIIANDPEAIIILAGDHGPHLTKNCKKELTNNYKISEITRLDIQDRYGTFLAIRWPDNDFEEYDDITVLQDIFPAVFAYLYKDESILESEVIPNTVNDSFISGAGVKNGIIHGGVNDGEPLYVSGGN